MPVKERQDTFATLHKLFCDSDLDLKFKLELRLPLSVAIYDDLMSSQLSSQSRTFIATN